MKKSGRKVLSVILTAVMVFALLPVISLPMVGEAEETIPSENHTHDTHVKESDNCSEHKDWTPISTDQELQKLCKEGGQGYLTNNIKIINEIEIDSNVQVSLCLNGWNIIKYNSLHHILIVRGTLNLYDENYNSGSLKYADNESGVGGVVNEGSFTMNGGTISNSIHGGVINKGSFTMNGGTISNNHGAGVYVEESSLFIMKGGEISGNYSSSEGGGVCVNNGKFIMTGGKITDNKVGKNGGGVYVNGEKYEENEVFFSQGDGLKGAFTMTGGEIKNNSANGVYLNGGTFTMNDGIISGNGLSLYEVYVDAGSFTMKGGKISSSDSQCGVYVNVGTFMMDGGEIPGYVDFDIIDSVVFITDKGNVGEIAASDFANKITYKSNDKNGKTAIQYYKATDYFDLAPYSFTNNEMKFVEWNTSADGSGNSYSDKEKLEFVNWNLDLYAQYIDTNVNSYDVTFKVKNGAWENGSKDDITVTLSRDENECKLLRLDKTDIPAVGNNPELRYKTGTWNEEPTTGKVINENKTYTYTYAFDPTVVKYTVVFDANGGTVKETSAETGYDHKLSSLPTPEKREGHVFKGWFTDKEGGTEITEDTVFDSDVPVYAQWYVNGYTIEWLNEDGLVLETDEIVEYGTMPKYNGETPTKDPTWKYSYIFKEWSPEVSKVTGEKFYVATYTEILNVYAITFDANGGNVDIEVDATNEEWKLDSLPTPSYEGYDFKGWFTNATGGTEITTDTVFAENMTIYAQWEKKEDPKPAQGGSSEKIENPEEPKIIDEPEIPEEPKTPEEPEIPEKPEIIPDYLDELYLKLAIARELGGEQTVEWNVGDSLPFDVMKVLENNPQITLIFSYTYEGENYCVTISGSKVTANPEIPWYGPVCLYGMFGGKKYE